MRATLKTLGKILRKRNDPVVTSGWLWNVVGAVAVRCESNGWTDFGGPELIAWHCVNLAKRGVTGMGITQYLSALESESRAAHEAKAAEFQAVIEDLRAFAYRRQMAAGWGNLSRAVERVTGVLKDTGQAAESVGQALEDLDLDALEAVMLEALNEG